MKKSLLAAAAASILALASSAAPGTPLEQALQAFQAGEYTKVLEHAAGLAPDHADWPRMQYVAGETHLVLGAAAEAEKAFRNVLAKRPKAVPAEVGLASALTTLGRNEEAAKILEAVLAVEPKDVGALVARGLQLADAGKLPEARQAVEAAWKLDAKNALTVRAFVVVCLRSDDNPGAASAAEAFAKARPEHPMGPFLLAWTMERDGEDEEAIAQYQRSLEIDANFIDAHKNLAILCHTLSNTYRDKARVNKAYEHYERYFALGGKDPELKAMYDSLVGFKSQILGM